MRLFIGMTLLIGPALVISGCGNGDDGHGHSHGGGGDVAVPDNYSHAVEKCEELSNKIGDLIKEGHLHDVHPVAAHIKKIAEKLAELAKKDLPCEMLRDVNVKARELAGMFSEIDDAADAGKKQETVEIHNKMKQLIADLKKYASHQKHDHKGGHHEDR